MSKGEKDAIDVFHMIIDETENEPKNVKRLWPFNDHTISNQLWPLISIIC